MIRKIEQLRSIFTKRSITREGNASSNESARPLSSLVYSLETPQFHLLKLNAINRISGFVFDCNSKPVDYLNIYLDDKKLGSFKVDGSSDDVWKIFPCPTLIWFI